MKESTAFRIAFALLIKVGRQNKELTKRDLAALVGISPRTITSYENEATLPNYGVLCKILDTLGYSFHSFATISDCLLRCNSDIVD